mgnify:CR=1 FL=1
MKLLQTAGIALLIGCGSEKAPPPPTDPNGLEVVYAGTEPRRPLRYQIAKNDKLEVEVSIDIDTNGIVAVSARDLATGREQSITVNATGTLSDDEIQKIIDDNELYEIQFKQ